MKRDVNLSRNLFGYYMGIRKLLRTNLEDCALKEISPLDENNYMGQQSSKQVREHRAYANGHICRYNCITMRRRSRDVDA